MVETFFPSILSHYRDDECKAAMRKTELSDIYRAQGAYDAFARLGNLFAEIRTTFKGEQ